MASQTDTPAEEGFFDHIFNGITGMFNNASTGVTDFFNNVTTGFQNGVNSLVTDFNQLLDSLNPMNFLRSGAAALMTPVIDFLRGIVEYVQSTVKWATGNDSTFGNEFLRQLEDLVPRPANDETAPRVDQPAPAP